MIKDKLLGDKGFPNFFGRLKEYGQQQADGLFGSLFLQENWSARHPSVRTANIGEILNILSKEDGVRWLHADSSHANTHPLALLYSTDKETDNRFGGALRECIYADLEGLGKDAKAHARYWFGGFADKLNFGADQTEMHSPLNYFLAFYGLGVFSGDVIRSHLKKESKKLAESMSNADYAECCKIWQTEPFGALSRLADVKCLSDRVVRYPDSIFFDALDKMSHLQGKRPQAGEGLRRMVREQAQSLIKECYVQESFQRDGDALSPTFAAGAMCARGVTVANLGKMDVLGLLGGLSSCATDPYSILPAHWHILYGAGRAIGNGDFFQEYVEAPRAEVINMVDDLCRYAESLLPTERRPSSDSWKNCALWCRRFIGCCGLTPIAKRIKLRLEKECATGYSMSTKHWILLRVTTTRGIDCAAISA